jgi:RNA polymerase sigma factor (sigma-70 family)
MSLMESSLTKIEAVYRVRGADFFRLALARTGDLEQARDAVQEGFAHAIRGRASFRGSGSLEAWVARCVINAAHDAARREAHSPMAVGDPDEAGSTNETSGEASSPSSLDPAVEIVRVAVRRLPQRQRDALFLRHYLDFDYAAIAQALGIEVGTVSATLHAARASLADNLQEVAK